MKIAFVILSCDYPGKQFEILLDKLSLFENPVIYIHHDYSQNNFNNNLIKKYNLILAPKHYTTYWSHINNVKATWDAFKIISEKYNPDWIITITPTCYPIKPIKEIESFLKNSEYDGYMSYRKVTATPKWELDKWIYRDMYHKKIMLPIINRPIFIKRKTKSVPFNEDFPIWHSSNYFMLNNKAIKQLLEQEECYNKLVKFYETFNSKNQHPCPQEIVIQSIIMNNCKNINICNNYYRYIKWVEGVWSPIYLTEDNYEEVKNSDALFARKFRSPESDKLTKLIDNNLL
ncbi:MAG: hypothetical protein IKQ46_02435 [Bacteroidales bacterium]|nr:hypothetical protein [Bacteroidales bacterium]